MKTIYNDALFHMADTTHEFGLQLSTLLKCVRIAEKERAIPSISKKWWNSFALGRNISGVDLAEARLAKETLIDHTDCEECLENWLYELKDETGNFYIGLTVVLTCLAFAQQQKAIPPLDGDWWLIIKTCY